ncbi:tRNA cyclic N6-threonylcarbamoyladenosine(37) synthase TcdA [Endozoicomonas sp. OPT23]|uniref:tRNA cyclic N6-threonylcarbamoyladenosine(37) synthase TcdA n=1 Tax=Endozoicomonas sp. OPT23 TaxID=2072845 RepID=UPI00129A9423|nr:tRNA cyclic N6-threonylcarbamoyladenosine(37) synthase TcdA [Endozoicomonas sp. OPT23]MRI31887.1 tRNA cyclic N6-threonylcarbamoyladenosine(37) synthase TcdA [Endozoicomonas sp. OPT23]
MSGTSDLSTDTPSESYNNRFGGTRRLYGSEAVEKLRQSHVCVIGIGGVGSWAAEALARTGVGSITLIDLDDICVTNINRQLHAMTSTVGQSKCEVMAERIRQINPDCQSHIIEDFISEDNLQELITHDFDYVLDAIDSFRVKAALVNHCKRNKIPIITTGGAGGQVDPTLIQITDLAKTWHDPLTRKVKSHLRDYFGFSKNTKRKFGVECVFSSEQAVYPQPDGTVCQQKPDNLGSTKMDCASGFGATTVVTATFGFVAVSRIIKKLTVR